MSDVQRPTVMIVDDDQEIIGLLSDYLKKRGFETITTTDPVTVVHKLRNFSIKLMILDLKMRKLDGFAVLAKIKQAGLVLPPLLIITGYLPRYQDQLTAHGIDGRDVVTKPFHFDQMEECVNRKLGLSAHVDDVEREEEDEIYQNNRCRIGFVEDEQDILDILSEFFRERNYKTSCFSNGSDALHGLQKEPVDILLVDIKLPGIQGDRLIEELNKLSNPPYMIPMSADPLPEEVERKVRALGCTDFFSKPFEIGLLIKRVRTVAAKKGLLG